MWWFPISGPQNRPKYTSPHIGFHSGFEREREGEGYVRVYVHIHIDIHMYIKTESVCEYGKIDTDR